MLKKRKNLWLKLLLKMPSLFFGFFLFALAMLLALYSKLGMSPWDVFHMGIVAHSMITLGRAAQLVGFCVILLSIFLGVIPGIGSIFNMIFIGIFVDLINNMGIIKTPESMLLKILMLLSAILIMGIATYFYLNVELGAGPRDGLMEGLVIKLNRPVWCVRGSIEITVLIIGFFLGGPVGVGTLLLAVAIGPSVQLAFKIGKYDSKKAQHKNLVDLYRNIKFRPFS
ncbi:YczE/YyaS/YitT family protein [Clostridium akagii]|uniref:YczE/YyaS/YitT family protein n=1 Tax=Clostridium akagii TaxID=91623 RepID=UPI000ABE4E55|nr:membrane protein [Clostridium akagii]